MQRELDDFGGAKELARYRMDVALEDLDYAKKCLANKEYRLANNRAYYAIFHAVSACLALKTLGFKKHGQSLGVFNKEFIHTEIFPKDIARKINLAQEIRHESDYSDFYIASSEETQEQVKNADEIVGIIKNYIDEQITRKD